MHDPKWARDNVDEFLRLADLRGSGETARNWLFFDDLFRSDTAAIEEHRKKRNEITRQIAAATAAERTELLAEANMFKDAISAQERVLRRSSGERDRLALEIPNFPLPDVPVGADSSDNVEHSRGYLPTFDFAPKDHVTLGERLGMMHFAEAAAMAGSRFVVLSGPLARLERALAAFMMDVHTREFGYCEIAPPLLLNDAALTGTGQLPKFKDDLFATTDGRWLAPTAEVPLTNFVRDKIIPQSELPLLYCAHTACFRAEAGAAGKDTRGMIRLHQFNKVELVSICEGAEKTSRGELERLRMNASDILIRLGLPFRTVVLCTGDLGFASRMTYDLEVWLPSQNTYREISSLSNCGSFQARRMMARSRDADGKISYVHTLNGSGLAVGRTLVAVMENMQLENGTIVVPEVLRPYMGGAVVIG